MNMKSNISILAIGILTFKAFLLLSCTEQDRKSFEDFSGFWVDKNRTKLVFFSNGFAVDDFKLGCIKPIIEENGVFFWVDSCVNVLDFNRSNEKYRIDLTKNNQLLIYFDNDYPDIPWVFKKLDIKSCEPQIVEIRLSFVGFVGPYLYYDNKINIDLVKDEVWINGILKENTKSVSWLKTYCYDEISTIRTDIDFPPAPTGVRHIYIELIYPDGRNELITLYGLLSAPLEVQALVLFLVSFLVY